MIRIACAVAVILMAVPARAADAVDGKTIFDAKCASCHGKDAKGNPAMAKMFKVELGAMDLSGKDVAAKKDDELAGLISKGKGKMPAFAGKLKEGEIAATVAYLRGLGGLPVSKTEASAATFAAKCASCHGKDAKGNPAMAKMFKVEPSALDLTGKKSSDELAGVIAKGKGKMPAFEGKLKADEIAGLAAYLASLGSKPHDDPKH